MSSNTKCISLNDLTLHLNQFLEIDKFQENIINGIQVAHTQPITKIATAVSASLETIENAIHEKVQALIVHHGILIQGDSPEITNVKYKKIKSLIENNIALLCYHLPLDAHKAVGNNWKAAQDLAMENLQPFLEFKKEFIGVMGSISPMSFDNFKQKVETYYSNSANFVKVKDTIKSVAIISGAGDKFLKEAALYGADCLITGRVDEPAWDDAHETSISLLSLGHYATETIGPKALAKYIEKTFDIPCNFIKTNNPF